jgi:FixJ family two-component response regulator
MSRGTVFLVDDDTSVRKALQRLLRAAGFEVHAFADGPGFLACEHGRGPACLVLDIRMPAMTGFEVREAIAGTPRSLPVVFITGHGDVEVRNEAITAGAVEVLFKPIDEQALVAAIEKALAS